MPSRPALSKGELEVARAVWDLQEATVGDVHQWFPKNRKLDYTTVQTYLRRLESKGYVKTRREGRNKIYSPKVRPQQVIRETVDDLMTRLFDGETLPLMQHLIQDRGISPEETQRLRELLDQLEDEQDDATQQ
jgi:predicted transcriptional regulator